MSNDEREAMITALREFATFLENNPDAPTPTQVPPFNVWFDTKEDLARAQKIIGGKFAKAAAGEFFWLRRSFGPINYDLNVYREVICERVVVGKQIVPAMPAQPEREEEIVEWKCGPMLGGVE